MRACVQDAFEGDQVDIIVDADCPQTGHYAMGKYQVEGQGYEEAAGEDGHSLEESIDGVEGKPRVRGH